MLWVTSAIKGLSIAATDGTIGTVSDLLFDDTTWRLRWLVADTGNWLPGRLVLLHPSVLGQPDLDAGTLPVALTREKVKESPDIQQDLPVSRQMEQGVFAYYGWDPYWGGGAFGMDALALPMAPSAALADPAVSTEVLGTQNDGDPHLRSVAATTGHRIHARDGNIGHLDDLLVDGTRWAMRYLIVDTGSWWPGKHVLLSPGSVTAIDWVDQTIGVGVTMDQVKSSPEWNRADVIDEAYEARLRTHYDWPNAG